MTYRYINRPQKVTVPCFYCEKPTTVKPFKLRTGKNIFCCFECYCKSRVTSTIEKCSECSKLFSIQPSKKTTEHPFCSVKCRKDSNRTTKPCAHCGILVTRIKAKFITENIFCSRSCTKKYRSLTRKVQVNCILCNKSLIVNKNIAENQKTFRCSDCKNIPKPKKEVKPSTVPRKKVEKLSKKVTVQCAFCNNNIEIYQSKLKYNKNFYCNPQCRKSHIIGPNNPAYRSGDGRKPNYGPNWRSQRRLAKIRDNYTCQHCGKATKKSRGLHVHHIIPFYKFNGDYEAANDLMNLITLCYTCHPKAEKGLIAIQPKLL